jgi:hypothetical protein
MAYIYNSQLVRPPLLYVPSYSQYQDAYSVYHQTKEEQTSTLGGPALPAIGHALAGSTGTAIANLSIYPLSLVITRLQVQRQFRKSSSTPDEGEYKGVLDAFEQIYNKEGGLSAFYTGVLQDTGKSIADSFLFFLFYNFLRTNRLQKHGMSITTLPVLDELAVGALAGACSKFFTTPISNIVARKQTASMVAARSGSKAAEPTVSDIANTIREEKGLQGFWSGYSASLVLTLNPSITFFLYEFFKRTMVPRAQRDDPGAKATFLMAAVSKAIASTITYPFSLAKSRSQTSSKPPVDKDEANKLKDEAKKTENKAEAQKTAKDAKAFAKKSTVFHTILDIYRSEGPAALYEGVFGEILKGFFSHGITMLLKEAIHKFIIQAYYVILKALKKYPSPAELTAQAGGAIQDAGEKAGELVKEGYENVSERVGSLVQDAGTAGERLGVMGTNATEVAKNTGEKLGVAGTDVAKSTGERLGVMGTNAAEVAKNAGEKLSGAGSGLAKTAGESLGVVGNNATEAAKTAEDYVSKDAGHLLGNARDMLGDKLIQGGKGVKNED